MVRVVLIIVSISLTASSQPSQKLKNSCLNCHTKQQIPSELIYRRYLIKYSTKKRVKEEIFKYLKNPKQELSIMPKQFFFKFPMKEALDIDNGVLKEAVNEYLEHFDIKKRLVLPQK